MQSETLSRGVSFVDGDEALRALLLVARSSVLSEPPWITNMLLLGQQYLRGGWP